MKHYLVVPAVLLAVACGKVNSGGSDAGPPPMSCTIACTTAADCPTDFTCGDLGLCVQGSDTCSCTAGDFIACDGDTALFCNPSANGVAMESCGTSGCNADAERCNECPPDGVACNADNTALLHCGSDGNVTQSDSCAAGCLAADTDPHCGHIDPAWLPGICDDKATTAQASLSGALNTTQAADCPGGIITVNNTMFCVVRAGSISIADLKVTGANAIAFVADESLTVTGTLDVSADGPTSGPGPMGSFAGGTVINNSYLGAGGGGFVQAGGSGGGETGVAGAAGGAVSERLPTQRFVGGARGGNSLCGNGITPCFNRIDFSGGGGGGAALLIACRGTVFVSGTIDAGGGGATGGGDHDHLATTQLQGGAPGGGSGGFVAFQGVQVQITGNLYANGGGGGGACGTDNCRGPIGSDGLRATTGAPGGDTAGNTCGGGVGGSITTSPGSGEPTFSSAAAGAGGGGGSVGRFEAFTPAGVTPVLTPASTSPAPVASTTSLLVN